MGDRIELNQPATKKKSKLPIILAAVLVVLIAGGFTTYAFLTKSFFFAPKAEKKIEEQEYSLKEFIVNLNEEKTKRYIKATVVLGYEDTKALSKLDGNNAQLRDRVISIFRSKSGEYIEDVNNTDALKQEIIKGVNELLEEEIVKNIYFVDILIQ